MRCLYNIFQTQLRLQPEKIYLYSNYGELSYRQVDEIIHTYADLLDLEMKNVTDRIVASSYSSPEKMFFLIWACVLSDTSLLLLPPLKDTHHVEKKLLEAKAVFLISDVEELKPVSKCIDFEEIIKDAKKETGRKAKRKKEDNGSFIFYTSGTTGVPKLVKVEYSQFDQAIDCLFRNKFMEYTKNKTVYIVPPLFHSYGLSSMLEYTRAGSSIKLPKEISHLGPIKELVNKNSGEKITAIEGVPYFYDNMSLVLKKLHLPNLKHIGFGGDAVKQEIVEKLSNNYDGVTFSIRYGLTETPSIVSIKVLKAPYENPKCSGRLLPIYTVDIRKENERDKDGAIYIKGRCIGKYLNDKKGNMEWFETGDYGYLEGNSLYITGRKSAFLKIRGYRISPVIIETVIRSFENVNDCMVYSTNNQLMAKIVIEEKECFSMQGLVQMLHKKVPDYCIPEQIYFTEKIPRTLSGKIVRSVIPDAI